MKILKSQRIKVKIKSYIGGGFKSHIFYFDSLFFLLLIMGVRVNLYTPQLIFQGFKVNNYISL